MEHSDYDIVNIDWGNKWLDVYLKDPDGFINRLKSSQPQRSCLIFIYGTLVSFGEVPGWREQINGELFSEARRQSKELWPESTESEEISLAKCILVLNHFAEKRLAVTGGV